MSVILHGASRRRHGFLKQSNGIGYNLMASDFAPWLGSPSPDGVWSVGLLGLRQVCFFDFWGCFVASPACSVIAVTSCGLRALASRCHSSSHCQTVCFLHSVDGRPRVSSVTVSTWAWRPWLWGELGGQVSLNLPFGDCFGLCFLLASQIRE